MNYEQENYEALCRALDGRNLKYKKEDDQYIISISFSTNDFQVDILGRIIERIESAYFRSELPFIVKEDKRIEVAIAINAINNMIVYGSFDYDFDNGKITYRLTAPYTQTVLSEAIYDKAIGLTVQTVDKYNDTLFALSSGFISLDNCLAKFKN